MQFKIGFELNEDSITKIKGKWDYWDEVGKWDHWDTFAPLLIEINDKNTFLLSDIEKVKSYNPPKEGLNAGLYVWFWDLVVVSKRLLFNSSKLRIDIEEWDFSFEYYRRKDGITITFNKDDSDYGKCLVNDIINEPIPVPIFIEEVIRSSTEFLDKILEINPSLKNTEDFKNFIKKIEELKNKWSEEENKY